MSGFCSANHDEYLENEYYGLFSGALTRISVGENLVCSSRMI